MPLILRSKMYGDFTDRQSICDVNNDPFMQCNHLTERCYVCIDGTLLHYCRMIKLLTTLIATKFSMVQIVAVWRMACIPPNKGE